MHRQKTIYRHCQLDKAPRREKHLSSQDTFEIGHLKLQQPKVQIIHV